MFSRKFKYYNIIIKSKDNKEIKLSLLENRPIQEAIDEFNSHIQDKKRHIRNLFIYSNNRQFEIRMDYKIDRDIFVFREE